MSFTFAHVQMFQMIIFQNYCTYHFFWFTLSTMISIANFNKQTSFQNYTTFLQNHTNT